MNDSVLARIEKSFKGLPVSDQLLLIERLVHQVRQDPSAEVAHMDEKIAQDLDTQLALMANDPEIQRELAEIEKEFAATSADGLEAI
ncbi:MAG TPA: hypothetical protein VJX67_11275 [Blastocatellia bacterium]|nr:hypothetical protein [Blastocatellia bacterium]